MTQIKEYIEKRTGKKTYWFSKCTGKNLQTGKNVMHTSRGHETEEEARFELAKLELDLKKGTYKKKETATFADVFRDWRIGYENTVRPITVERTMQQFKKYILPKFGDKSIDSISLTYCQQVVNEWSNSYTNFKVLKSCVQRVLDYAVRSNYRSDNPMRYVQMPRKMMSPEELMGETKEKYYDTETLNCFLKTLQDNLPFRDYAIFRTLSYSGLRTGELMGIIWSDVNFENNTIKISRNLFYLDGKIQVGPPKTKKSIRTISMDKTSMEILRVWREQQELELTELGISFDKDKQWVFNRINKKNENAPLYHKYTDTVIDKVLKLNKDLPPITTHGFRHTHASILIEANASLKEIQEKLGHSSIMTTSDTYGHLTKRAMQNTGEKFEKHMNQRNV